MNSTGTSIDFEAELNAEQLAAVTAPDGPVLVIAAAGTGKTRTLTYRVAYLVQRGIDARRTLLLTFTNKAAREMLDRAHALVGESVSGLWGGTFHHMANRLLRRHAPVLGYTSGYTILDQDDAKSLVRTCVAALNLRSKEFPKPEVILSMISLAANTARPLEEIIEARFQDKEAPVEAILRVHRHYRARKRELNAMDFDDLLVNGLRLFETDEGLRERYQQHFLHVLVDEYQDTNVIQARWVDTVAQKRRNLLVVGDDFQSIYGWRGANFRNIMEFPKRYPGTAIFRLEVNYRSVPEVLAVANACIAGNREQFQKTLRPVRGTYRKPVQVRFRDGTEQARFVVDQIRHLVLEGYPVEEMAILYRAHFHALELQLELAREGMPYVITSGVRFFEQAHIKDVCTVLRLLGSPADQLAFERLTAMLPRVGNKTAIKVWEKIGGRFPALDKEAMELLHDALPAGARAAWKPIERVFLAVADEGLAERPGEVVYKFLEAFYEDYAARTFENFDRRLEDVNEFANFSARYETLEALLNEMALLTNTDTTFDAATANQGDGVRLSTVHQAKGLEWKVVFILWLTDGMFPSQRSLLENGDEAEERRLFYVAVTRAEDELYLCIPQIRIGRDGSWNPQAPSRFVREVPGRLMERRDGAEF